MKRKLLISGSAGFVGTNLCEWLGSKHEIVGVDLVHPREAMKEVTYIKGDMLDRKFIEVLFRDFGPFEEIVHVAAQARVEPSLVDPVATYRSNVEATINLLEAASKQHGRFIYASSETIYGNADRYPTRENDHFRPISPYAASKVAADVMVQQMNGKGLDTVVVRSGMGFGPRSPPAQVITKMLIKAMDGHALLFPKESFFHRVKHPTRDINYIGNFVRGIENVLDHPGASGVYNMGSGREVNILELARRIVKVVGRGKIAGVESFSYRAGEEGMRTWMDIGRARKDLGYDPRISLDEGLEETYAWLRDGGREFYGW